MKYAIIHYQGQALQVEIECSDHGPVALLPDGRRLREEQFQWLPPATGTMLALGLNYADHAQELAFQPPTEPLAFIKAPNTYTGHNRVSWRPDNVQYMHYECELVAVIGKQAKNVKKSDAAAYLAG